MLNIMPVHKTDDTPQSATAAQIIIYVMCQGMDAQQKNLRFDNFFRRRELVGGEQDAYES